MKIRLFTIPNIITLLNLLCGCLAIIEITIYQNLTAAFWLVIASSIFDFLDGMAARLLGQYSAIGVELDSLSDMVSFGLTPSIAMFTLFNLAEKSISNPMWIEYGGYIAFIIVCFSALRLAKFNVDSEQQSVFIGLPTPANALFCVSLGALHQLGLISFSGEVIALIAVVMALMLILPIPMLALKFKSLSWRENRIRYIFIALSAATIIVLKYFAVPTIILLYYIVSIIGQAIEGDSKKVTKS